MSCEVPQGRTRGSEHPCDMPFLVRSVARVINVGFVTFLVRMYSNCLFSDLHRMQRKGIGSVLGLLCNVSLGEIVA